MVNSKTTKVCQIQFCKIVVEQNGDIRRKQLTKAKYADTFFECKKPGFIVHSVTRAPVCRVALVLQAGLQETRHSVHMPIDAVAH